MQRDALKKFDLPDVPGVYLFKKGRRVLYVGKATSLRDRVRSYFDDDLIATRGPRIVDMVTKADSIAHEPTPTVLEALVREAALIRKYNPPANAEGKDDKTFLYACITKEEIPRVLAIRGSNIDFKNKSAEGVAMRNIFGPFPSGYQLREGLRLIRRIFPFYDTAKPVRASGKHHTAKIEFNKQIGQYPAAIDRPKYLRTIRNVELFLGAKTKELRTKLARDMQQAAREERFEEAALARKQLFALDHIQDVSLIKDENLDRAPRNGARIEAYDTAHISGTNAIGVMTVIVDGLPRKSEYRAFKIRGVKKNDDVASLKEILSRRLAHSEWPLPKAIVVDGGIAQRRAAEGVLKQAGVGIPVVAVVKDEKHRPREIVGAARAGITDSDAVLVNAEAHRFSLARHRAARTRALTGSTKRERSGR